MGIFDLQRIVFCVKVINKAQGEVSERLKVQTWKVCVGATSPGVRIPPSPIFPLVKGEIEFQLFH